MRYAVEVAHLVNGELVSVRHLSARRQRAASSLALGLVLGAFLVAMTGVALIAHGLGRAVYAPGFLGLWLGLAALSGALAYRRVSRRLGRYSLGSRLDADAFAPFEVDLVRRLPGGHGRFELTIVPGMQGTVESGRVPLPVEAFIDKRPRAMALGVDFHAELRAGASVFVVSTRLLPSGAAHVRMPRDLWRLFARVALGGLEVAVLGTFLSVIPRAETIGDRPARAFAGRVTTPWEAEKRLRLEAQEQAASLHQCFDPLPLACQHPGYVGVGVSLNREGELRSNWIARSTYGQDCPVDACMKEVVSTWLFDPLPEAMRVVLPVQVLRTEKPLPARLVRGEAELGANVAVEWTSGRP